MVAAGTALAVHEEEFQLDGDTTPVVTDQTVPDPDVQTIDWESLFNADGTPTDVIDFDAATGFNDGAFIRDFRSKTTRNQDCAADAALSSQGTIFCTTDFTTFATGSKDTLDVTDWQCNRDNNVNSKIDIMNGYAAQFIEDPSGDQILYFGLDKNKDNGNNNVAFWFLQNEASCSSSGGAVDFSGAHVDGDVLVVSAFTNGGGVSGIDAYRWDGDDACIDNPVNPATCDGLPIGSGGDCKAVPTGTPDSICATTNSGPLEENDAITTLWLTSDATLGVGHTVVPPDFFEGGINLTEVFEGISEVPSCFSTFIADTRSSQSLTATLFDFAAGQLGGCSSTLTTSAAGTASGSIGTGTVSSGTDTATLTIDGTDVWAGTLTFYLCGPVTTDGCDDTGVLVTTTDVNQDSLPAAFVSGSATLTSAGRYCWTAHFEPDEDTAAAGVDPADDDGENECFDVAPVTPLLTTQASCSASPCVLGSTLSDTATLSGTASQPGSAGPSTAYPTINPTVAGAPANGSITWVLYAPSNGGCTDTRTTTPTSATVSGDNTYGPVTYTTLNSDPIGTYTFVANYGGGDGPNTNAAATVTCAAPGDNETVTVIGQSSMSSAQDWLPNDTVTLTTNGGTLTGTLTITLYEGTFTEDATGCTPGAAATEVTGQEYTFNPSGAASPAAFETSNEDFFVTEDNDGNYFWLVDYDDANLDDPASHCESTSITITD